MKKTILTEDTLCQMMREYVEEEEPIHHLAKKYHTGAEVLKDFLVSRQVHIRTHEEQKKTKNYREKHEAAILDKYGVRNVSQSQQVKKKKAETFFEHFGTTNNFGRVEVRETSDARKSLDPEFYKNCAIKARENLLATEGICNVGQRLEVRTKNSQAKRERFSTLSLEEKREITLPARTSLHTQGPHSKIEAIVEEYLDSQGIAFNRHKYISPYFFDIQIDNHLIEVNGDFWHGNPYLYLPEDINRVTGKTFKQIWTRDYEKFNLGLSKGFSVSYIWEKEIRQNFEAAITEVLNGYRKNYFYTEGYFEISSI